MSKKIALIDYGVGNLRSVENALRKIGAEVDYVSTPECIPNYEHILLPGVGAFSHAIKALHNNNLVEALTEHMKIGKPLLGVCLGMQLLADFSEEDGVHKGLGWIPGKIRKLPEKVGIKIPHMGWNSFHVEKNHPIFSNVQTESDTYFVHGYYFDVKESGHILARTEYGDMFPSIVGKENVIGMQFHPEKSQDIGLHLLKNFIAMA